MNLILTSYSNVMKQLLYAHTNNTFLIECGLWFKTSGNADHTHMSFTQVIHNCICISHSITSLQNASLQMKPSPSMSQQYGNCAIAGNLNHTKQCRQLFPRKNTRGNGPWPPAARRSPAQATRQLRSAGTFNCRQVCVCLSSDTSSHRTCVYFRLGMTLEENKSSLFCHIIKPTQKRCQVERDLHPVEK